MAIVAITIKDTDTGVEIDVRSDTEMNEDTELTPAQGIGLATTVFLGALTDDSAEEEIPSLELPAGVNTEEDS